MGRTSACIQLVAGTIIAKCQQARRRRQLKERMRTNVRDVVLQLRHSITGEEEDTAPPLHERLLRAYAGYFVAARDAEENVWGAASMCLVTLGVFCDTLEALQQNDIELAGRLADEVEASTVGDRLAHANAE
jgi:RNA-dependent RNA polymerase